MDRLRQRVDLLRWLLPLTALAIVTIHQVVEHTWLRHLPWKQHFATQFLFYGVMGPAVVWLLLTWISRSVAARERATNQLTALHDFSRNLATAADEDILDTIVRFSASKLGAVGSSLMLFDAQTSTVTVDATWGLSDALPQDLLTRTGGVESVVCVPLERGGNLVGRLNLFFPTTDTLTADQLRLLSAMAAEAASAVEALRLRTRALQTLYDIDQRIRRRLDLDRLLHQILADAVEACGGAGGVVLLLNDQTGAFQTQASVPDAFVVDDSQLLVARISERRGIVQISDLDNGAGPDTGQTVVGVPMTVEEEVIGVLCIVHPPGQSLTDGQLQLLSAVASQTALIVQNARFYARLEGQAVLEERARLAREMHDGLAQGLGYLNLKVQQTLRRLEQERPEAVVRELHEVRAVVQDLYAEVRSAIDGLRIPFDVRQPFVTNLAVYAEKISAQAGISIAVDVGEPIAELPPPTAAEVLRIVQEALNNIVKHADADAATIEVRQAADGLCVVVRDDGRGFDAEAAERVGHVGLQVMRERAEALGAQLDIQSGSNGTAVTLELPWLTVEAEAAL
jgi:signal transduction histidine kinase